MIVGDSPPTQEGEPATEEQEVQVDQSEGVASVGGVEDHKITDSNEHVTDNLPSGEIKGLDEQPFLEEGLVSKEAEKTSEEEGKEEERREGEGEEKEEGISIPPATSSLENTSTNLEAVNDLPAQQVNEEREISLGKVCVFCSFAL